MEANNKQFSFAQGDEQFTVEFRESGPLCFEVICPKCQKAFGRFPTERGVYWNLSEHVRGLKECPNHVYRNH